MLREVSFHNPGSQNLWHRLFYFFSITATAKPAAFLSFSILSNVISMPASGFAGEATFFCAKTVKLKVTSRIVKKLFIIFILVKNPPAGDGF